MSTFDIALIANQDSERLLNMLADEAAFRESNNLPPFWFERLFGFNVELWQSISTNDPSTLPPRTRTQQML